MILTWFVLWPLLLLPLAILFVLGAIPDFTLANKSLGGYLLRDMLVNSALALFTSEKASLLAQLYEQGDYVRQLLIYGVIALNLNMVILPFLYGIGELIIKVSSWLATAELESKTRTARR